MISSVQWGQGVRPVKPTVRMQAVRLPVTPGVNFLQRFKSEDADVFRLSRSLNNRLARYLHPFRAWMPIVPVPKELRKHTDAGWVSNGTFLEAVNRQASNAIHQGVALMIWDHVFDGYNRIFVSQGEQFHPYFEAMLIDRLGMLQRGDSRLKQAKVKISKKVQTYYVIDEKARPDLKRLMGAIHSEYRSFLSKYPEHTSSFNLRVSSNQIVADQIKPALWE